MKFAGENGGHPDGYQFDPGKSLVEANRRLAEANVEIRLFRDLLELPPNELHQRLISLQHEIFFLKQLNRKKDEVISRNLSMIAGTRRMVIMNLALMVGIIALPYYAKYLSKRNEEIDTKQIDQSPQQNLSPSTSKHDSSLPHVPKPAPRKSERPPRLLESG